jgi:GDPmannose 4,6-dehydratase
VLSKLLEEIRPHEVYNLGAQSHVRVSFDMPIYTAETVAMGALKLLEAVRDFRRRSGIDVRYYQASSSEQYGKVLESPADGDRPRSTRARPTRARR